MIMNTIMLKHVWDGPRVSCMRCGMLYGRFRELLMEIDAAKAYHEDMRPIEELIKCR